MSARRKLCRYHCRGDGGHKGCSTHFSSLEAFDLHRQADEEGGRTCIPPKAVVDDNGINLLHRQTEDGECKVCPPYPVGITVWTTVRSDRAAGAFSALGAKRETPSEGSTGATGQ
jgi:hypothetical protein